MNQTVFVMQCGRSNLQHKVPCFLRPSAEGLLWPRKASWEAPGVKHAASLLYSPGRPPAVGSRAIFATVHRNSGGTNLPDQGKAVSHYKGRLARTCGIHPSLPGPPLHTSSCWLTPLCLTHLLVHVFQFHPQAELFFSPTDIQQEGSCFV